MKKPITPANPLKDLETKGYQGRPDKVQGGHQGPTSESAPANPPSGGSSGKPTEGSGEKK